MNRQTVPLKSADIAALLDESKELREFYIHGDLDKPDELSYVAVVSSDAYDLYAEARRVLGFSDEAMRQLTSFDTDRSRFRSACNALDLMPSRQLNRIEALYNSDVKLLVLPEDWMDRLLELESTLGLNPRTVATASGYVFVREMKKFRPATLCVMELRKTKARVEWLCDAQKTGRVDAQTCLMIVITWREMPDQYNADPNEHWDGLIKFRAALAEAEARMTP